MKKIISLCAMAMLFITFTQAVEVDLSSLASSYDKGKEFQESLYSIVANPIKNDEAWETKVLGIEPFEKSTLYQELQTKIQNGDREAKNTMEWLNKYDVATLKPFLLRLQASYKADYLDSVHQFFSSVGTPCTASSQTTIRAFDANEADVWCLELPEPYDKILKQEKIGGGLRYISIGFFTPTGSLESIKKSHGIEADTKLSYYGISDARLHHYLNLERSIFNINSDKGLKIFKGTQIYNVIVYLTQEQVKTLKEIRIKASSHSFYSAEDIKR